MLQNLFSDRPPSISSFTIPPVLNISIVVSLLLTHGTDVNYFSIPVTVD